MFDESSNASPGIAILTPILISPTSGISVTLIVGEISFGYIGKQNFPALIYLKIIKLFT